MLAERMVLTAGGGYPQGPYPGQPGAGTIDPQSTTGVPLHDSGNNPEGGQS